MVVVDPLQAAHPLDHLVAVLGIGAQAQRTTVNLGQGLVVHAPGEDALVVVDHRRVDALVVGLGRTPIVGVSDVPEGSGHQVVCALRGRHLLKEVLEADALPLRDAGPPLHAGVHRNVRDLTQGLQLVDGERLLLLDKAADLETEVLEVVLAQGDVLLGLLLCRRARVDPVERGNVVLGEGLLRDLTRLQAVDRERANGLRGTPHPALRATHI